MSKASRARDLGVTRPGTVADLAWSAGQAADLGGRSVALWEEFLEALPELPIHRGRSSREVAAGVAWEVPDTPDDLERLVEDTRELMLDWSMYPGHGGFMGYVSGAGTIPGAAADLLAAAVNNNVGGWRLSPGLTELEQRLLRWFAAGLGLPPSAGGYLTSGGSAANHDALALARDMKATWDVRRLGMGAGPRLTVYAPATVHDSLMRGADLLGMGHDAVRLVPVDGDDRVEVAGMRAAIEADVAAGYQPICVVGSAGTVGTGAVDDLDAIAELAEAFGLWFHVDGAVGAVGALVDGLRDRFSGISRADSISLDPHKWLYVPIACGMLLVRDAEDLTRAFHIDPSYTVEDKERMNAGVDVYIRSPFFTRPAAVLKLWWSLRAHGWGAYQRRMIHDCELARYLHDLAIAHPRLEATSVPDLMIATFRYVPEGGRPAVEIDALNQRIMERLQYSGRVYPSNAVVDGRPVLRACIVNFRTEAEDIDALVDLTVRIGDDLATAGCAPAPPEEAARA